MLKLLIFAVYIITFVHPNVLPPYASQYICHTSDPNFHHCLITNTNLALRRLKHGVPEANISSLDPMFVEHFESSYSMSLLAAVGIVFDNITILGQSQTEVTDFTLNLTERTGRLDFYIPVLNISGIYQVYGQLLGMTITSKAAYQGNFTEMNKHITFKYERININGTDYYNATSVTYESNFGSGRLKLTPVSAIDDLLVYNLQQFFNNNFSLVMWATKPQTTKAAEKFYRNLINGIINKVPADEMLPK